MIELSDRDILARLTNPEDSTVERKTAANYRDCLRTAVAFSNSLPVGDPGIIFVGVGNDGTLQDNLNLDRLQMDISRELKKIFPPIAPQMKVMDLDGRQFLALIVRGSDNRPHFAGPSFIRDGSQTKEASAAQFDQLIAERNSKVRKILEWRGRKILVALPVRSMVLAPGVNKVVETTQYYEACVTDCNQFFVTLEFVNPNPSVRSWPTDTLLISFDHERQRLALVVGEEMTLKHVQY